MLLDGARNLSLPVRLSNYNRKQRPSAERFNLTLKALESVADPRFVKLNAVIAIQATQSEHPQEPQVYKSHRLLPKLSFHLHNTSTSEAVHPLETQKLKNPAGVAKLTAGDCSSLAASNSSMRSLFRSASHRMDHASRFRLDRPRLK
jgi:hypothetical protein